MCSVLLVLDTTLAVAFWMSCNCVMVFLGSLATIPVVHPPGDKSMGELLWDDDENDRRLFWWLLLYSWWRWRWNLSLPAVLGDPVDPALKCPVKWSSLRTGVNALKTNWGRIEIRSLGPHLEAVWAAYSNILSAVCTRMCPWPHWRTAYSTDILCVSGGMYSFVLQQRYIYIYTLFFLKFRKAHRDIVRVHQTSLAIWFAWII